MAHRGSSARAFRSSDAAADLALQANQTTYEHLDHRRYIDGAPHLKHISIAGIYRSLVLDAIRSVGRDPSDIWVLDVGAGNGMASIPWLRRNVRLTAVDSSEAMLDEFRRRAEAYGSSPRTVVADALEFLRATSQKFDVVTHVSMLHHIPDYMELLRGSVEHVRSGGCLITFQDPLRYDRMPNLHRLSDRASYFAWRLGRGNYKRGLKTRWRRLRGIYSPDEAVDFDEYHVVRNGVDSDAIAGLLRHHFADVRVVPYWSTYSPLLQAAGERTALTSSFGILATGRRAG